MNYNNATLNQDISDSITNGVKILNLKEIDFYTVCDLLIQTGITDLESINGLTKILLSLFSSFYEGSLCIKLDDDLIRDKINILTGNMFEKEIIIENFLNNLDKFKSIIAIDENEYKPLVFVKINNAPYLYFQKNYSNEKKIKSKINMLLTNYSDKKMGFDINEFFLGSDLNIKQKMAVCLSLIKNFVIISGGPGTGKTYIIYWILKLLLKSGYKINKIKLASPTGRASENLTFSIRKNLENENDPAIKKSLGGIEATTIHRLLKYVPGKNNFYFNEENKLPIDALIIDEASMLDVELANNLFSSLADDAKIIFIGDKDQLPPVEAGAVLSELIPDDSYESFGKEIKKIFNFKSDKEKVSKMNDRIIVLNQCYRASGLNYKIAQKINQQDLTVINDPIKINFNEINKSDLNLNENCFFIDSSKNKIYSVIDKWIEKYFFNEEFEFFQLLNRLQKFEINNENIDNYKKELVSIFSIINKSKILTVINDGIYGMNGINNYIQNFFIGKNKKLYNKIYSGMPVIITQNDYFLNLFNGNIGVIIKDKNDSYKVIFQKARNFKVYFFESLMNLDISYSITVHKSQGSEYDDLLVILPDNIENNMILTKEIIYTSLTRAKNKVYIYGKPEILSKSINKKVERISGLNLWN